ncbi:hydrolase 1, exosortase A system-associated [Erythrobacter insulae]|uniref:Hydrolase 1, exosortase A system-associated n=1 Tax=Erythrobacter insulae TaxID=2584124 RepID=A0A547PEE8_9SPHN|nr:hydrolase 1, exosortase A system-associated [Erythrobacter insulae]TRD12506.1 hydrolase 1, exosortase A system-associated [Erythrobacter insulae]
MSRLALDFGCGSLKLAGALDTAPGMTGLLIVSGGNEIRSGAFSGQSRLAARIAQKGFPVFRFDRRGVGDSEGENRGFRNSQGDIEAALTAFKAMAPQVERFIGFGNCDAASALMLMKGTGFDGLVLSNPWTIETDSETAQSDDDTPPPAAIRARYAEKLRNPAEWARLVKGGVDLGKLVRGIAKSVRSDAPPSLLADQIRQGLNAFDGNARILLASRDRTAQEFERHWDSTDPRISRCEGASHAYVEPQANAWLEAQILAALRA